MTPFAALVERNLADVRRYDPTAEYSDVAVITWLLMSQEERDEALEGIEQ